MFNFEHTPEGDYHNLLGDIYQRVDVEYAKWMYLSEPTFHTETNPCCEAHPQDEFTNQQRVACATARYLNRYRSSPQRSCWINIENPGRLEVRAFSSNTMKDRLIKNFQFMEALLLYSDAVTYNYQSSVSGNGIALNILDSLTIDEFQLVSKMLDEDMFLRWYVMSGLDNKYPELTRYLNRTGHLNRIQTQIVDTSDHSDLQTVVNYS